MTECYLTIRDYGYEGFAVFGVWLTRPAAEEHASALGRANPTWEDAYGVYTFPLEPDWLADDYEAHGWGIPKGPLPAKEGDD